MFELNRANSAVFSDELNLQVCGHATSLVEAINLQTFYIKLVITLCKQFSPFKCSNLNDQIQLLKSTFFGILATRVVFHYNCERNRLIFIGNESCDRAIYVCSKLANESKYANTYDLFHERFAAYHQAMQNDAQIRNLLMLILLFSPHQSVAYSENIRYHYFVYNRLLWRYLQCKYASNQYEYGADETVEQKYSSLMTHLTQIDALKSRLQLVMAEVEPKSLLTDVLIEMYSLT